MAKTNHPCGLYSSEGAPQPPPIRCKIFSSRLMIPSVPQGVPYDHASRPSSHYFTKMTLPRPDHDGINVQEASKVKTQKLVKRCFITTQKTTVQLKQISPLCNLGPKSEILRSAHPY